ncbi:MAG: 1-(5-phosphoribosyl)-5-[(5-phosphoribosylamino)methylideneamino]imidazole-4-carboxamide isomerase [Candidatus Omnitrophica bacterium 4484_70.2]|nr:MAG: 1-(5-phosphoribosyl)-5-[(5-phosphoribosylamino)methylideneamino]imidazole-4-carboxamide isomerase [Candidatus Omnitrophica bacterium 4484_70.2]
MVVIPAIDILDKKVVRLYQGRRELSKVYSDSPLSVAQRWKEEGAKLLHIVDLNASFGDGNNLEVVKEIVRLKIDVELGGGIREEKRAEEVFGIGVKRVIISTQALDDVFLTYLLKKYPFRVGVSVDVAKGRFMREGWQKASEINVFDFIHLLIKKGVEWIVYTDICKDGTLSGPNIKEIEKLASFKGARFIISGGIRSIDDIKKIKEGLPSAYGVIVGKALYEGRLHLKEATEFFKEGS